MSYAWSHQQETQAKAQLKIKLTYISGPGFNTGAKMIVGYYFSC
jgi:hypothetical protein